jgi:hypothetical protein
MVNHPRRYRPNTEARVLIPDILWQQEAPIAQRVDRNTTTGSVVDKVLPINDLRLLELCRMETVS